jgi:hypothetical protein
MNLSEEERRQKRSEYNRKYKNSDKGKEAQRKANKKYQQTDNFKNYKRNYYLNFVKARDIISKM